MKFLLCIPLLMLIGFGVQEYRINKLELKENRWLSDYPISSTGPLKGILIGIWWVEIQKLQLKFQYQKIDEISKRICLVNPYVPPVWEYLAWNMSYNIAAEYRHEKDIQFSWVMKGYDQLEKGLTFNPKSSHLLYYQSWYVYAKLKSNPEYYQRFEKYLKKEPYLYCLEKVEKAASVGVLSFWQSCFRAQLNAQFKKKDKSMSIFKDLINRFPMKKGILINMMKDLNIKYE